MRALSIRQPWAELILLGHKTIEVQSQRTNILERVHIYARRNRTDAEEEARIASRFSIDVDALPRGVLVGTVEIVGCRPLEMCDSKAACFEIDRPPAGAGHWDHRAITGDEINDLFAWLLERPERAESLQAPKNHPRPIFFDPF